MNITMENQGTLLIGTSGFHYEHWVGRFYPEKMKKKDWLNYYVKSFKTLELNNTFYHTPLATTFDAWNKSVPQGFVFSVKANRFITHQRKLKGVNESLGYFLKNTSYLHEKLGPILFQLPPTWNYNAQRFSDFLDMLPEGFRYTFEFRSFSWHTDEVFKNLKAHNCAFCIYDLESHVSPLWVTADFVYVRLHGPKTKYAGSYSDKDLLEWAEKLSTWKNEGKDVYVYFNNDQQAHAVFNALKLIQLIKD